MAIWNTVKSIQESMTILLTTHSMEEADALCSRIAILTSDGIQCLGSQIHLKDKYGRGLMFSVLLIPSITNVVEYVQTTISPDLEFLEERSHMSTFTISKDKVDLKTLLQHVIDLQHKKILIRWSISQSSLNDVFVRVCKHESS